MGTCMRAVGDGELDAVLGLDGVAELEADAVADDDALGRALDDTVDAMEPEADADGVADPLAWGGPVPDFDGDVLAELETVLLNEGSALAEGVDVAAADTVAVVVAVAEAELDGVGELVCDEEGVPVNVGEPVGCGVPDTVAVPDPVGVGVLEPDGDGVREGLEDEEGVPEVDGEPDTDGVGRGELLGEGSTGCQSEPGDGIGCKQAGWIAELAWRSQRGK